MLRAYNNARRMCSWRLDSDGSKKKRILQAALLYVCLLFCFLSVGCGKAKESGEETGSETSDFVIGFSQLGSESART